MSVQVEYPKPDALITITVAEYHCLTKAATLLEVIVNDGTYDHAAVVKAVKTTIAAMRNAAEAGAEE
jgi:hypothetical protein